MRSRVLIIEDNDYSRTYTRNILQKKDYEVYEADCGSRALTLLKRLEFHLLLLDLNLKDISGMEIIRILRQQNIEIPIMVVTSTEQIETKVNAFNLGCDDYLTRPVHMDELLARMNRLCKRIATQTFPPANILNEDFKAGPFVIHYVNEYITQNGKILSLNRKLFDLLSYFITNHDQIISKTQLFQRIWGENYLEKENTLSVHIHMLREKLEDNPRKPVFLITKRGYGYIMKIPEVQE